MTPGRAALVVLMQRYIGGLMDPFVSLLEVHKLLYFLQESGEGLRLQYRKAHYGPYAETQTTNATESGLNQSAKVTCPAADKAAESPCEWLGRIARMQGVKEFKRALKGRRLIRPRPPTV